MHLTEGLKAAIAERLMDNPDPAGIDGGTNGLPVDVPSDAGTYVDSLQVSNGAIVATMKLSGVSPCVKGKTLTLAPFRSTTGTLRSGGRARPRRPASRSPALRECAPSHKRA
ncbi:MAG: pilin [Betaproteobacteria bacterium]|nr:pilin [Betaproteobacteria bacterium]